MIHSKLFIRVASKGDREEFYIFVFFLAFSFLPEYFIGDVMYSVASDPETHND